MSFLNCTTIGGTGILINVDAISCIEQMEDGCKLIMRETLCEEIDIMEDLENVIHALNVLGTDRIIKVGASE